MRPAESVGHAFARQRRDARGKDYYERIECVQRADGDHDCNLTFGRSGKSSDDDFGVTFTLQVHADATLASRWIVCLLAG